MAHKRSYAWPIVTVLVAVLMGTAALPQSAKRWAPGFLQNATLHFGLDLVGGTQLDFRISEQELEAQVDSLAEEISALEAVDGSPDKIAILREQMLSIQDQQRNIVEAIRTVLERRINALGVSESIITPSYIGNEKHLLVECPGVVDTQACINTIGKTISLEFKEERTEETTQYTEEVRKKIARALRIITQSGETLAIVGQDLSDELGISYIERRIYYEDELPEGLEDLIDQKVTGTVLERDGTIKITQAAQDGGTEEIEVPGSFLIEILEPRAQSGRTINEAPKAFELLATLDRNLTYISHEEGPLDSGLSIDIQAKLRSMKTGELSSLVMPDGTARVLFLRQYAQGREVVDVSHILISYAGASIEELAVERTQEEAAELIAELKERLDNDENFEKIARTYSDGPSGAKGGSLGLSARSDLIPTFANAAFNTPEGEITGPVETQFGYHIIKVNAAPARAPDTVKFEEMIVKGEDSEGTANGILSRLQRGDVKSTEDIITVRGVFFSFLPTGWSDTLLDGKHFRAATVTLDPITNIPIVQISFDEEGGKLFQELTKANTGKRIAIFVGGQLVSAPTVQGEILGGTAVITGSRNFEEAKSLATDLNTGAMPAPIYLTGQRTVEATLGAHALKTSIQAALIGIVILMIYMIVMYRVLGLLADIALSIYAVLFFAILKMPLFLFSSQYIVLTLAGMAGIILSIGMAVDANVLIFERMKEELRKGKMFKTAAETGFARAWPSIRDGNVSTFITCTVLFLVGTSMVRGFAITLGLGVLLSMFSAIVITRFLIRKIADSPIAENTAAFGVPAPKEDT